MAARPGLLSSLYRQRGLIGVLVERELKARYRGTLLGYVWSLLNPLLLLVVYTLVFTVVIPARVDTEAPYPLFLFAGLLPWLFLSGALLDAAIVLPDNGPLLKKVVCPPEVFPVVTVLSHLVHHILALPILVAGLAFVAYRGDMAFPWTLLLLPLPLLLWTVATAGIALAVAALAVHFRDIKDLLHNFLNLLFFLTPIIYTRSHVPDGGLRRLVDLNPVSPLLAVYRDVALNGVVPGPMAWVWATVVAAVSWLVGAFVFSRLRDTLAETV